MASKQQQLAEGNVIITSEKGSSMTPLIKSGQKHELSPCKLEDVEIGDIVYCKVRKSFYTHLVTAKNDKLGLQISNNHGFVNGWTKRVFGKVTKIL